MVFDALDLVVLVINNFQKIKTITLTTIIIKKPQIITIWGLFCGPDGTRTRDLLRDRQAF